MLLGVERSAEYNRMSPESTLAARADSRVQAPSIAEGRELGLREEFQKFGAGVRENLCDIGANTDTGESDIVSNAKGMRACSPDTEELVDKTTATQVLIHGACKDEAERTQRRQRLFR